MVFTSKTSKFLSRIKSSHSASAVMRRICDRRKEVLCSMTRNQIEYWKNEEQKRANKAQEEEAKRSNLRREGLTLQSNLELGRHNRVTEGETGRTNRANEAIRRRSNEIAQGSLDESKRHNLASETNDLLKINVQRDVLGENIRHSKEMEAQGRFSNQTQRLSQQEQSRHNRMDEGIRIGSKAADIGTNLLSTWTRYDLGRSRQNEQTIRQLQRNIPQVRRQALPG